jgi:hypothetical protein
MARRREGDSGAAMNPIRADEAYGLKQFGQFAGLKETALKAARANGLKVVYCHGRAYVLGSDWLEYLRRVSESSAKGINA